MRALYSVSRTPLRLLVAGILGLCADVAAAKIHLKVTATAQVVESFTAWTKDSSYEKISHFDGAHANRPTVDLVLQLQALRAGGLDFDFEFSPQPNNARARLEVTQGNADITAETTWDYLIDQEQKDLLRTESVIRDGEFEKAIYVLPTNTKALQTKSLEDLQQLTGITVSSWDVDVRTLRALKLKGLELPAKSENVYGMLAKERADFTLLELSSLPDLSNESNGVRLIPIPGIKIALNGGSRAWIVSRASPNAEAIHTALVKGTKILRDEGRITRAFKECGFFNPRAADWKRLY
jgi:hypothetical protein